MKVKDLINKHLSKFCILIILSVYIFHVFNVKFWNKNRGTISWDIISYYAYLPATFIHHDLSLEFTRENPKYWVYRIWPEKTPDNKLVIKTTMGLAYLYSPFFFVADFIARHNENFIADGYSLPYHIALSFSSMLYIIFGFLVLWQILQRYFSRLSSFISILSIGLATNLFCYTTQGAPMPHSFNFSLIIFFTYLVILFYEKKTFLRGVLLGICLGLITLIRPTNFIVILIFFLYGITNFSSLRIRIRELIKSWPYLIVIAIFTIAIWIPQLIYWKTYTGKLFYYSYGSQERFFWLEPAIWKGLFSFRKGWLIYTPVMIFSLIGIPMLAKKAPEFKWVLPFITIVSIYIIFSWWCWWYGGGFGSRPMIDYYGILAIPLTAFIQYMLSLRSWKKKLIISLFSISILFGAYHHLQYYYGAIHWDAMTKEAYFYNFGKIKKTDKLQKYLLAPDYKKAKIERE